MVELPQHLNLSCQIYYHLCLCVFMSMKYYASHVDQMVERCEVALISDDLSNITLICRRIRGCYHCR